MGRWWGVLLLAVAALLACPQAILGEQGSTAWSQPVAITANQDYAATPTLVYTGDGTAHSVWEDNGTLLYAFRSPGGQWSVPTRVAVGIMPSLAAGPNDTLYLLFSHDFLANDEIYYVTYRSGHWSLPINVSHTTGSSLLPALTVAPDGTLNATWQDNTPGDWVIYYGRLDGLYWSSQPIPNARGQNPALGAGPDGQVYVAWQGTVNTTAVDDTDVFLAEFLPAGSTWTLPVNVSDTPGSRSMAASVAVPADGLANVAWVENDKDIYFSYGRGFTWSAPQKVASASASAQEVRLAASRSDLLFLSWVEDQTSVQATYEVAHSGEWAKPASIVALPVADRRDLALATQPGGGVSAAWVQANPDNAGLISVYESSRTSIVGPQVWLPLVTYH